MSNQAASPDQLEREIYETRAQIDRKLGLLQERLSPRNVANAMGAQGGTFARNLGTALRDNPVPALLLGIGICWLMLASRPNGRAVSFIETPDAGAPVLGTLTTPPPCGLRQEEEEDLRDR